MKNPHARLLIDFCIGIKFVFKEKWPLAVEAKEELEKEEISVRVIALL